MALATKVDFDHTAIAPPTGGVNAIEANDGGTPVVKKTFGVPAATSSTPGVVKPDNSTITIVGGVITSHSGAGHADDEVAFTSSEGDFTLAHGLGYTPTTAIIQLTDLGIVVFQGGSPLLRWDGTNLYLRGSAAGLTGFVEVWK